MLILSGCSSDDDDNYISLHNSWMLVSYGNESNKVLKEAEGYYYIITFNPDNTYSGWAYMNEMGGEYKCRGNNIEISHPCLTKVYYEGADEDMFFLEHLSDVSTYVINDRELRLYYSKDEYFKFRYMDSTYFISTQK